MTKTIRILSIDDSNAVHAFLERSFKETQFELIRAMNGQSGLEILGHSRESIALILLDWELPDKSGPEILLEIRKDKISTPVIMLTSKSQPADIQKMLESGASEYIMKPFTPDILIEKINSILTTA